MSCENFEDVECFSVWDDCFDEDILGVLQLYKRYCNPLLQLILRVYGTYQESYHIFVNNKIYNDIDMYVYLASLTIGDMCSSLEIVVFHLPTGLRFVFTVKMQTHRSAVYVKPYYFYERICRCCCRDVIEDEDVATVLVSAYGVLKHVYDKSLIYSHVYGGLIDAETIMSFVRNSKGYMVSARLANVLLWGMRHARRVALYHNVNFLQY